MAQGEAPWLALRVCCILSDKQGVVEEGLFALAITNAVLLLVLAGVAGIPLKANAIFEILEEIHTMYMSIIYAPSRSGDPSPFHINGFAGQPEP